MGASAARGARSVISRVVEQVKETASSLLPGDRSETGTTGGGTGNTSGGGYGGGGSDFGGGL
jgi:hypothetical protein